MFPIDTAERTCTATVFILHWPALVLLFFSGEKRAIDPIRSKAVFVWAAISMAATATAPDGRSQYAVV